MENITVKPIKNKGTRKHNCNISIPDKLTNAKVTEKPKQIKNVSEEDKLLSSTRIIE